METGLRINSLNGLHLYSVLSLEDLTQTLSHSGAYAQVLSNFVLCCCRPGPGGKQCLGGSVEHKVCEGPPCAKGLPTFRDQQCQAHERQAGKKKSQMWAAVVNDGEVTHAHTLYPA